ncbi:MAG TPA: 4-(cytidine 5'-diphospho)-2-C-methyl-D-erythritol kinase [Oxalobacteraceae bacterium]|nr:4-(cytidine 5'-diphospho)-2-C-methyl-D-erythritol kinase [Oxalobacteraceae bacterium]
MPPRILNDCLAPAKLNLFLHVTGRRADGYHLLQTVFQLLDYGDLLHFETRDDGVICRTTEIPGVAADSDLIVRAARLLQATLPAGRRPGVNIAIDKKLPMGGGLGGGSSDAATTLIALNHLWEAGLSRQQLMELGLQLGADVPFFIFGRNAFAAGVGEELTPVATPGGWYVVLEPGVSVPTQAIFSAKELTRDTKPVTITDFSKATIGFGKNDLQVVAAKLFPDVAEAIAWLEQYGAARMTGSGACVFCHFSHEPDADAVLKAVPARWKAWKARAIAQHPLAEI